nr:hypothetical protein [Gammaproteobacteria bacterium]
KTEAFAKVKASIKKIIFQQKFQQVLSQQHQDLTNLTYTNPTTLKVAAKRLGVPVKLSPMMTRQGKKQGLFSDPLVLTAAFTQDVFVNGNNSNPITLKNGSLIVVRIAKKIPAKEIPLGSIRGKVRASLIKNKAQREAGVVAYNVQQAIAQSKSLAGINSKYLLNWQQVKAVTARSKTVSPQILNAVFKLPANQSKPATTAILLPSNNYAIIHLTTVKDGDYASASVKQLSALKQQLLTLYSQLDYRLFVEAVHSLAKIKIHKK